MKNIKLEEPIIPLLVKEDEIIIELRAIVNRDRYNNMPQESKLLMIEFLAEFVNVAAKKWVDGQHEHGGNILERNCIKEAQAENVDQMYYLAAQAKQYKMVLQRVMFLEDKLKALGK